jgi:type II secretory pathway pseudopilin PulG
MTGEVTPTDSSAPLPPEPPAPELPALPGLAAEEAAGHGRADRFRTWVAIAIALVSILGAVVAFSGTLAEQEARHLDQQGIQDAARQQQIITDLQATVDEDLRYLAPYQEHLKAAQVLDDQANTLAATDPTSAGLLHAQAQSERVLARTLQGFFQGAVPDPGQANGPATYDAGAALRRLETNNADLQQLRPEATLAMAEDKHGEAVNLVGLVTLFIAALLFLTLAQFTRPQIRRLFAAAGGATTVAGIVLWILVLRAGP